ncbi:hypothetical protein [Caldimonas tepidiphila]|uniref:hypothetical protein n=1 Tax=Caldimonas tepidiphila TaxID=2315841 RepID=UPI0013007413|nr:hypothetical protein [Caldimonas tepidiphila]
MPKLHALHHAPVTAAVTLALLAGCATQNDSRGPLLDWGAIQGVQLGNFPLADGSSASLRFHNGRHSVKLHNTGRIIDLGNLTRVRIQETRQVQGRTIAVLDAGTRLCPHRTLVLAVQGSQPALWDLGNCRMTPKVRVDGGRVLFEFIDSAPALRYDYQAGQMRRQLDFGRWQAHQSVTRAARPLSANPSPSGAADEQGPSKG